jgi:hypothetical protein
MQIGLFEYTVSYTVDEYRELIVYNHLSNFQLSGDFHHYRWQGRKFKPLAF